MFADCIHYTEYSDRLSRTDPFGTSVEVLYTDRSVEDISTLSFALIPNGRTSKFSSSVPPLQGAFFIGWKFQPVHPVAFHWHETHPVFLPVVPGISAVHMLAPGGYLKGIKILCSKEQLSGSYYG